MTVTQEIAATIKAALAALVPTTVTRYVDGMPETVQTGTVVYADGVADTAGEDVDREKLPCVAIVVSECLPQQYRSVLRAYPVVIEAATWQPEDTFQFALYELAAVINPWLCEPSLSLTLSHFDALTVESEPEYGIIGRVQYVRWMGSCKTRKATA